jgi:3-methylcrotonyl-CoA carboxylase alpha subunit
MPSVGRIKTWRTPEEVGGLRIDAGYRQGSNVSPHYDAMLAKVIAWAPTRDVAIDRLNRGLEETDVRGVVTNIPFLSALITHPDVRKNKIDTGFIERHLKDLTPKPPAPGALELAAAVAAILTHERQEMRADVQSPWQTDGWMPVGQRHRVFTFKQGPGTELTIARRYGGGASALEIDGHEIAFAFNSEGDSAFAVSLDGARSHAVAVLDGRDVYVRTRNGRFEFTWADPFSGGDDEHVGEDRIVAPLPGTVVALLAKEGETLEKGAPILTLEVMKMEQTLRAPFAGTVKRINCKVGDIVQEGVELAEIEPTEK